MDKNDKTEDINFEEIARFGIYEAYILSDYYLGFRVACENIFETSNKEIRSERPLSGQNQSEDFLTTQDRCDTELHKAILLLNDRTGIPHGYRLDDEIQEYHITEPELHFDYFPLTIRKYSPDPPKMLTFRFDLERGLEQQLKVAKNKLQDAQKDMKMSDGHSLFEDVKTTRKTMNSITDAIQMVANRDQLKKTKNLNWDDTVSALNLKKDTAIKRYEMGNHLILSGEIHKYSPEFR